LTPIVGAEVGGIDLSGRSATAPSTSSTARLPRTSSSFSATSI